MVKLSVLSVWQRRRRLASIAIAVMLGVSFLTGTLVLGDTLKANFDRLFAEVSAGTSVVVRNQVAVDPKADDFFRRVIEARQTARRDVTLSEAERDRLNKFLKLIANSGSYGLFAEVNEALLRAKETVTIRVHGRDDAFEQVTKFRKVPQFLPSVSINL